MDSYFGFDTFLAFLVLCFCSVCYRLFHYGFFFLPFHGVVLRGDRAGYMQNFEF